MVLHTLFEILYSFSYILHSYNDDVTLLIYGLWQLQPKVAQMRVHCTYQPDTS